MERTCGMTIAQWRAAKATHSAQKGRGRGVRHSEADLAESIEGQMVLFDLEDDGDMRSGGEQR